MPGNLGRPRCTTRSVSRTSYATGTALPTGDDQKHHRPLGTEERNILITWQPESGRRARGHGGGGTPSSLRPLSSSSLDRSSFLSRPRRCLSTVGPPTHPCHPDLTIRDVLPHRSTHRRRSASRARIDHAGRCRGVSAWPTSAGGLTPTPRPVSYVDPAAGRGVDAQSIVLARRWLLAGVRVQGVGFCRARRRRSPISGRS